MISTLPLLAVPPQTYQYSSIFLHLAHHQIQQVVDERRNDHPVEGGEQVLADFGDEEVNLGSEDVLQLQPVPSAELDWPGSPSHIYYLFRPV